VRSPWLSFPALTIAAFFMAGCATASDSASAAAQPAQSEPPLATEAPAFVNPSPSRAPSPPRASDPAPVVSAAPSAAPLKVKVTALTKSVRRGGTASVTVQTTPGADCDITVTYASGQSEAAGLADKTAGKTGYATWKWRVGPGTTKGTWPIDIYCVRGDRSGEAHAKFTVK
jgi:hypothetical protein